MLCWPLWKCQPKFREERKVTLRLRNLHKCWKHSRLQDWLVNYSKSIIVVYWIKIVALAAAYLLALASRILHSSWLISTFHHLHSNERKKQKFYSARALELICIISLRRCAPESQYRFFNKLIINFLREKQWKAAKSTLAHLIPPAILLHFRMRKMKWKTFGDDE